MDDRTVAAHGIHQAGIDTAPQSAALFVALDLLPDVDAAALRRLLRILASDIGNLTAGQPALADTEPELARDPARLTITVGFGPGLVARTSGIAPSWLAPLPPFSIDKLESRYSDGDLLLQICADDATTVAHAARMLLKDARSFADVRWTQRGFRAPTTAEARHVTTRNLFGQLDGSANFAPGTPEFNETVWIGDGPEWLIGGTSLVLRRIALDLEGWDRVDRSGRESAIGRTLDTGAPLTGIVEADTPDFEAVDHLGFPVISATSHVRRARSDNPTERIFRRGYNYDESPEPGTISQSGLLFASFQADIERQFLPIQRRLAELDILNRWTTPIGSAVFAIPRGFGADGYPGDALV